MWGVLMCCTFFLQILFSSLEDTMEVALSSASIYTPKCAHRAAHCSTPSAVSRVQQTMKKLLFVTGTGNKKVTAALTAQMTIRELLIVGENAFVVGG